jgi:hypothetical protein
VKPEFFKDRRMADLGSRVVLVYQALWLVADDGGVARAEPDLLHGEMFSRWPEYTPRMVADCLGRLQGAGRITLYAVGDDLFAEIPTFTEHQRIEKPSKFRHPRGGESVTDIHAWVSRGGLPEGSGSTPAPIPIPTPIPIPEEEKASRVKRVGSPTWLTPYIEAWVARYGGQPPIGILSRNLRPLEKQHPPIEILARWNYYLGQTDPQFVSAPKFAQTYGQWAPRAEPMSSLGFAEEDFYRAPAP